jgi:hypothetical protein
VTSDPDKEAARRLISEKIDSFEKLEIVVYLHRSGYAATTPAEIAKATSMATDEVTKCMHELKAQGVLDPSGPWAPAIATLSRMYDEDRIEVLNLMTNTALARVRKEAARVFADAFVLRPKKKGDPDA